MRRTFTLPYIPPGSNQLHRMHWAAVGRWRQQIRDDVTLLTHREPLYTRARLTIEFRWRDRRSHDVDNALAGAKALIDALKGRWIVDDDADHLQVVPLAVTGTGEPDCVIVTAQAVWTDDPDERY